MRKMFKLNSRPIQQGLKRGHESQQFEQPNFVTSDSARFPFCDSRDPCIQNTGKAGVDWFVSGACRRQAFAIFAATIASESRHTTTAILGGTYAKQK
jgi:hypothetical protein